MNVHLKAMNVHLKAMNIFKKQFSISAEIRSPDSANIIMYLVVTLLGIGTVMVYSTSSAKVVGGQDLINVAFLKHILFIILAIAGMFVMMKVDYHYIQKYSAIILFIAIVGLIIVLIPKVGTVANGARRWIRFGSHFGFQPSEFAKLAMIIFMSSYIAKRQEKMASLVNGFVIPMMLIGFVSFLILKEPDFGTATFISLISLILIIVGGARITYIILALLAAVPHIYSIIQNHAYLKSRILTFFNPWSDSDAAGYQIIQSWIALGSGGLTGLGLGESRQKLFFLPESNNDFIFSILGEELGFLGTVGVIIIFALLTRYGIRVCKMAPDAFGFFLALGITISIALQSAVNIAVATGCIPTTGFSLPLISTGGSSLLLSLAGIGILLNIAKQSKVNAVSVDSIENKRRLVP